MTHKIAIEGVDKLLRDLMDCDKLFWQQSYSFWERFQTSATCCAQRIKCRFSWSKFDKILHLATPWKSSAETKHAGSLWSWFHKISSTNRQWNRNNPTLNTDNVQIPYPLLIPYTTEEESLDRLITTVFPNFTQFAENEATIINRAILTTKNEFLDEINETLMQKFPGNTFEYISRDKCLDFSQQGAMEDFINSLAPNGLPSHRLA